MPMIDIPNLKQLVPQININIELLWYSQHHSNELGVRYYCEHRKSENHSCSDCESYQCDVCESSRPHFRFGHKLWCVDCMNNADRFASDEMGTHILDTKLMKTYTYRNYFLDTYLENNDDCQVASDSFAYMTRGCYVCSSQMLSCENNCAICTLDLNYHSRPYYLAYHGSKQGSKQIKVCGKCTLNREKIPELNGQLTFIDMRKRIMSTKEVKEKINLWDFFSEKLKYE